MLKAIHQPVLNKELVATASHAPDGTTLYKSSNWAGYMTLPGGPTKTFKKVSAFFTVPSVNCTAGGVGTGDAFVYHWIGLDGWTDKTVEQDGIGTLCSGGTPEYISWWETYPGGFTHYNANVNAGDQINATVAFNGSDYVMTVKDVTTGTLVVNATEPCEAGSTCKNSSAEAITEGYPATGWLGTADYGRSLYSTVEITNQAGTTGGFSTSSWKDGEIEAVGATTGHLTSQPGALYQTGSGTTSRSAFAITWLGVN